MWYDPDDGPPTTLADEAGPEPVARPEICEAVDRAIREYDRKRTEQR